MEMDIEAVLNRTEKALYETLEGIQSLKREYTRQRETINQLNRKLTERGIVLSADITGQ